MDHITNSFVSSAQFLILGWQYCYFWPSIIDLIKSNWVENIVVFFFLNNVILTFGHNLPTW